MDRRLRGRRLDYVELVRILDQGELLNSSFGNTYELTRPVMPGADLCTPEADSLCVSSQGRRTPLSICMDGRAISSARPELEVLDPRGLFLVEAFSRVGWIDMYSRGYVAWLIETGQRLSPFSFGCGGMARGSARTGVVARYSLGAAVAPGGDGSHHGQDGECARDHRVHYDHRGDHGRARVHATDPAGPADSVDRSAARPLAATSPEAPLSLHSEQITQLHEESVVEALQPAEAK